MYTTSIILIDWQNKITMLFQKVHLECYYYCTFKYGHFNIVCMLFQLEVKIFWELSYEIYERK